MKNGFIKIACGTPKLKVADCIYNESKIIEMIFSAYNSNVKIIAFPELCITGYTCGDLFLQSSLLASAENSLINIAEKTSTLEIISIVGLPFVFHNKLYNVAAVIYKGEILGIVPKKNLPNYSEFYEARHFTEGDCCDYDCIFNSKKVTFGTNQIFTCEDLPELTFGIEICEDLWVSDTPSIKLCQNGANIIFNLSASDEIIGKKDYRRTIIKAKSGTSICAYAYADAGIGESTTDMVFAGHNLIAENGSILKESELFKNGFISADIDLYKLSSERRRSNTWKYIEYDFFRNKFKMELSETNIERYFPQLPFVPSDKLTRDERCKEILTIQAVGLMTRLKHIGTKNVVLGLSGGLDSTLALIVTVHAFDMLGLDKLGIHAITMPCFGTTDRTYNNACKLAMAYGVTLNEINIRDSVNLHLKDIQHNPNLRDVTYENAQARERTQVLMDKANQLNGIVIGTGDLSELALGWATYNGDHMSMYSVNASIPKTLVRWLVSYEADNSEGILNETLLDILDTPVSPELLPPDENDDIIQKTEDVVGPYELHDFFLYYMLRFGFSPAKIFRIANIAFAEKYNPKIILKWEKKFYWRFFSQQFKRSCLPDGPKVGSVAVSPRGDLRMPSDASVNIWIKELEEIEKMEV